MMVVLDWSGFPCLFGDFKRGSSYPRVVRRSSDTHTDSLVQTLQAFGDCRGMRFNGELSTFLMPLFCIQGASVPIRGLSAREIQVPSDFMHHLRNEACL